MKISVIIPTYNGAGRISNVLESLIAQSLPADEVVVVVDGSNDNTAEVAERFKSRIPLKIVITPNGGRSVARNVGVKNSTGDLLVFLDDDMRAFPNCLKDHHDHHLQYKNSLLTGAISEDIELVKTDIQLYRKTLFWRKGYSGPGVKPFVPMNANTFYLAAANFSISRELFEQLGGFDEQLRDAEDYDLGMRARLKGFEVYGSSSQARAFHDDPLTCVSYIRRQRQYRESKSLLLTLKPRLYEGYIVDKRYILSWHKRLIFSIFAHSYWAKIVDSGILKYLLPEKMRFRIYDLIISGMADIFPNRKLE